MRCAGGKEKLKGSPSKEEEELKGYLLIRYLWTYGTDNIHDMHVVNTDAPSYQAKNPKKCLETAENKKKRKYPDACLKQRRNFTPFIYSVDILLRVKAEAKLKRIYRRLATKWKESYSCICRYKKIRFVITLFKLTHCCIRGARVPDSQISMK